MDNIFVNTQSSIKIYGDKIIYFDPYCINNITNDADIIFITHEHYDHFSIDDINKVMNDNTIFVLPGSMKDVFLDKVRVKDNNCIFVKPNTNFKLDDILVEVVPSYNVNKPFHKKEYNWCGYIVNMNNIKYYIAGDTDDLLENHNICCDVAFIPIGGVYTMDYMEAAKFISYIKPKTVIPIHYGSIVGSVNDGNKFKELVNDLDKNIEVVLKI